MRKLDIRRREKDTDDEAAIQFSDEGTLYCNFTERTFLIENKVQGILHLTEEDLDFLVEAIARAIFMMGPK